MKMIFAAFIALCTAGMALPAQEPAPASEFALSFNEAGDCAVVLAYYGQRPEVIVPEEVDGFPVREIAPEAFRANRYMRSLVIPEGVAVIGRAAFSSCSVLSKVILPESVSSIGENAFASCPKLSSINLPSSLEVIKAGTFFECLSLSAISLPPKLAAIEGSRQGAFEHCDSLSSIALPDSLSSIGEAAFYRCASLVSVSVSPVPGRSWYTNGSRDAFRACPKLNLSTQAALKKAGYSGKF